MITERFLKSDSSIRTNTIFRIWKKFFLPKRNTADLSNVHKGTRPLRKQCPPFFDESLPQTQAQELRILGEWGVWACSSLCSREKWWTESLKTIKNDRLCNDIFGKTGDRGPEKCPGLQEKISLKKISSMSQEDSPSICPVLKGDSEQITKAGSCLA